MLLAESETYVSKNPTKSLRLRYCRVTIASAVVALALGVCQVAIAATPGVPLFADDDIGNTLAQAVQTLGADAQPSIKPQAGVAACDPKLGASPRLALLVHVPSRTELDRCGQSSQVSLIEIGRQAVALVVPANSPVWSLDAGMVFRALGQNGGDASRANTWDQLDPVLPKLPIGILLPPANSRTQRLFNSLIMDAGCDRVATARTPFDVKGRTSFCGTLRSDIATPQRQDGAAAVANWSAAAPPGQIAVVSVAELTQLDRRVVPLLIEGALPTAANIESGRYPAADKIFLLIVMPHASTEVQRVAARDLAFNLLAEASIGPAGSLVPAGLLPLPPTNRIAARSQAIAFLESR